MAHDEKRQEKTMNDALAKELVTVVASLVKTISATNMRLDDVKVALAHLDSRLQQYIMSQGLSQAAKR